MLMSELRVPLLAMVMAAGATACSPASQDTNGVKTTVYNCGSLPVTAEFAQKQLTLTIEEQQLTFTSEPSASGVRYFNPDHNAQFWTKGSEGQLVIDDNVYPLCTEAGTLPLQLSARGNEPFWLLQRKDSNASLRRPSGDRDFTQVQVEYNPAEANWTLQLNADSQLIITEQVCTDTMSGMPYPYTAQLQHDGSQVSGCAGEPRQLLAGATWHLHGTALTEAPTIRFMNDGRVSGFAGCNRFFGNYQLTGESLQLGRMAATKMMCGAAEMAVEDELLENLANVHGFAIEQGGLLLRHSAGTLAFVKATPPS